MLPEELARLPLFAGLAPAHLALLAPLFRPVHFAAGAKAFAEGDAASFVYVLVSGDVTIQFRPSDGGCLDIARIRQGGVFGWSAALGRPVYTSSAVCGTPVETLAAQAAELRRVMLADAELGAVLLERMADVVVSRLEGLRAQLTTLLHAEDNHDSRWR